MIANKKYLVTCDNKVLRTNDQIDLVTSLLYHEGSKFQNYLRILCQLILERNGENRE